MSQRRSGREHDAGGIFIETMHNAAPGQCRHLWCMRQQAVDEGAAVMARGWMHHQSCGLVQHDHMLIFMQDLQREVLGDPLDTCLLYTSDAADE